MNIPLGIKGYPTDRKVDIAIVKKDKPVARKKPAKTSSNTQTSGPPPPPPAPVTAATPANGDINDISSFQTGQTIRMKTCIFFPSGMP